MTERETEDLAFHKHHADAADGSVILSRMAKSIQIAVGFVKKNWTPRVHKLNG